MTCPHCAAQSDADAAFCIGCGKPLARPGTTVKKGKGLWIALAIGACLLPALVLGGVAAYGAWSWTNAVHLTLDYDTANASPADLETTRKILEKRLGLAGLRGDVRLDGPRLHVAISSAGADSLALDELLRKRGKLEMIPVSDVTFESNAFLRDAITATGQEKKIAGGGAAFEIDAVHREAVEKVVRAQMPGFMPEVAWEPRDGGSATLWIIDRSRAIHPVVESAVAQPTEYGTWNVLIKLDAASGVAFEDLTRNFLSRNIPMVVDGVVISSPLVQSAIPGGTIQLSMGGGSGTAAAKAEEAKRMANVLGAGELPIEITRVGGH